MFEALCRTLSPPKGGGLNSLTQLGSIVARNFILLGVYEILHHKKVVETIVGFYRSILIAGFLRWCKISSLHLGVKIRDPPKISFRLSR